MGSLSRIAYSTSLAHQSHIGFALIFLCPISGRHPVVATTACPATLLDALKLAVGHWLVTLRGSLFRGMSWEILILVAIGNRETHWSLDRCGLR